jgi:hypothetical protein
MTKSEFTEKVAHQIEFSLYANESLTYNNVNDDDVEIGVSVMRLTDPEIPDKHFYLVENYAFEGAEFDDDVIEVSGGEITHDIHKAAEKVADLIEESETPFENWDIQ